MNIAYFGSPEISADLLRLLLPIGDHKIALIVTQPDKAVGKRLTVTSTPVKQLAIAHNIEIFDKPLTKTNEQILIHAIKAKDIHLAILFAYGEILSQELLDCMRYGIWNVHPSLLPKYRGPSPTAFPLIMGDRATGTTLMQMNEFLDKGDIIYQNEIPIYSKDNRSTIEQKVIPIAGQQVIRALEKVNEHRLETKQQDESSATYTRLLKKNDGFISLELLVKALKGESITFEQLPAIIQRYYQKNNLTTSTFYRADITVYNLYRGLFPWPGVWTEIKVTTSSKRVKLIEMKLDNGQLQLEKVQLEGKRPVDFPTFNRAYNLI